MRRHARAPVTVVPMAAPGAARRVGKAALPSCDGPPLGPHAQKDAGTHWCRRPRERVVRKGRVCAADCGIRWQARGRGRIVTADGTTHAVSDGRRTWIEAWRVASGHATSMNRRGRRREAPRQCCKTAAVCAPHPTNAYLHPSCASQRMACTRAAPSNPSNAQIGRPTKLQRVARAE